MPPSCPRPHTAARAAIVDAAAQMMYQKGVAATSLDDILAASSTGKSQLYHYFKDRSDLVKAVVERQTELVLAAQPTLSQIDSMEGIERWAQAILANHEVPEARSDARWAAWPPNSRTIRRISRLLPQRSDSGRCCLPTG
ncbi:bacterial regulatory s, tetR family protein [Mycobacteroides abscessus subsp. bolletii 1513]|uniref:Bacterial regulatory s, tetR family protein n=1 Tax=Mycobacteroides abscessus subsp. bolletii 1513 TaxID=1299321 RepID=X8DP64_9MYCO|nr:bacterial regulatory s, tetR family protein [Mycobacteroides abscessus subsp. bolletii 1513]